MTALANVLQPLRFREVAHGRSENSSTSRTRGDVLMAAKSSRAGLAAWVRAHGVDGRSLNAWRVNLERRVVRAYEALGRSWSSWSRSPRTAVAAPYVLRVGGVELEVGDGFDEQSLRRLVGVLRSC